MKALLIGILILLLFVLFTYCLGLLVNKIKYGFTYFEEINETLEEGFILLFKIAIVIAGLFLAWIIGSLILL